MSRVALEAIPLLLAAATAVVYGGYRMRQRDRSARERPHRDFRKPPNEGDLL